MLCSYSKASRFWRWKSRATLYRLRRDGWLKDYEETIEGKRYLDMKPSRKDSLERHCMGVLAYRNTNIEIIDYDSNIWGSLEILVDPYTDFAKGITGIRALQSVDVNLAYLESFAAMQDVIAA